MEKEKSITTEEHKNSTNRIIYFDILNILAIIAVIAMHCNGIVHSSPLIKAWNTSLIVDCIFYWAVPIFFMLSGANLIRYRERYDTKTFFKKRFIKILIPFLFWSIFMIVWKTNTNQLDKSDFQSLKNIINVILNNEQEGTYYFMQDIIGIYLTMPLLSLLAKNENRKALWLTVLFYFIFNATLTNILPLIGINYGYSLTVQIGGYVVYVLLGYLLSTQDLNKRQKIVLYIFAILGLLFRYITTFIWSKNSGEVIRNSWGYTSWHCILLAGALFVFVRSLNFDEKLKNKTKIKKYISTISSCSFGIYLIHKIIMYYEIGLLKIDIISWQWRTFGVIATYFICLLIVFIMKKIPILKNVLP